MFFSIRSIILNLTYSYRISMIFCLFSFFIF